MAYSLLQSVGSSKSNQSTIQPFPFIFKFSNHHIFKLILSVNRQPRVLLLIPIQPFNHSTIQPFPFIFKFSNHHIFKLTLSVNHESSAASMTTNSQSTIQPLNQSPFLINKTFRDRLIRIDAAVAHKWPVGAVPVAQAGIDFLNNHLFSLM